MKPVAFAACIVASTIGASIFAQDARGTIDDAVLARLQGEWRYTGMTINGKPQVRDWEDEDVSTFFQEAVMALRQGKTGKPVPDAPDATLTHLAEVDGFVHMDVFGKNFEGKDVTTRYLCRFDGDTLTCTSHMMNPEARPTVLESAPGSFLWKTVYRLRKASGPAKTKPAATSRTWTSTAGTTVEATFVEIDGDVVVLEKKEGGRLRVPLEKLSPADRTWLDGAGR